MHTNVQVTRLPWYQKPQMIKTEAITIPLQGLSDYHHWITSLLKTPTCNKFTYHSILLVVY
jgi:hypothetical protein